MARKIVVTSGKGGVGKTTVAVRLGMTLAKKGARVVICDADFGLNNADLLCGLEARIAYDVVDVAEGRCRAKQALVQHPKYPNLYLLSGARDGLKPPVSAQSLKLVLDRLGADFDFIFIDSPAGIDEGFHRAAASASEAIVVTTPHISSIRDADKAITLLKSYGLDGVSLVVNMARGDLIVSGEEISPEEIAHILKLPLLGAIPEDYAVTKELAPHAAFGALAQALTGKRTRPYDIEGKYTGFFGGVRRLLKRCL